MNLQYHRYVGMQVEFLLRASSLFSVEWSEAGFVLPLQAGMFCPGRDNAIIDDMGIGG
jgi:hypothetical protein